MLPVSAFGLEKEDIERLRSISIRMIADERIKQLALNKPGAASQANITRNCSFEELTAGQRNAIDILIYFDTPHPISEDERQQFRQVLIDSLYRLRVSNISEEFYSRLKDMRTEVQMLANALPLGTEYTDLTPEYRAIVDYMLPRRAFELEEKEIDKLRQSVMNVAANERIRAEIKAATGLETRVNITHKCDFKELTQTQKDTVDWMIGRNIQNPINPSFDEWQQLRKNVISQLYQENGQTVMREFFEEMKNNRVEIRELAGKIPVLTEYPALRPELQQRINALLPVQIFKMDEDMQEKCRNQVIQVIEKERIQCIISQTPQIKQQLKQTSKMLLKENPALNISSKAEPPKLEHLPESTQRDIAGAAQYLAQMNPEIYAYAAKNPEKFAQQICHMVCMEGVHRQHCRNMAILSAVDMARMTAETVQRSTQQEGAQPYRSQRKGRHKGKEKGEEQGKKKTMTHQQPSMYYDPYFVDIACLEGVEMVGRIVYDDLLFSPLTDSKICRIADEISARNAQLHRVVIYEYREKAGSEPAITVMRKNEFEEIAPLCREYRGVEISQITDSFCALGDGV